jgi:hypothetical protein
MGTPQTARIKKDRRHAGSSTGYCGLKTGSFTRILLNPINVLYRINIEIASAFLF